MSVNGPVVKFFSWGFEYGEGLAESSAFGPLPASIVQAIETYWRQIFGK